MRRTILSIGVAAAVVALAACSSFSEFARGVDDANRTVNTADSVARDPLGSQATRQAKDDAISEAESAPLEEPASCCVNGAFYSCGTMAALHRCSGQPMELVACSDRCTLGDLRCEDSCLKAHGPNPSQCQRETSRDGECT